MLIDLIGDCLGSFVFLTQNDGPNIALKANNVDFVIFSKVFSFKLCSQFFELRA